MPVLPETPTDPGWKPSGSCVVDAGMSNSTQCVNPPGIGTSGSCMMRTNDFAFAGASFHARAGDGLAWPASHVNFDGIVAPSMKAGLVRLNAAATTTANMEILLRAVYSGRKFHQLPVATGPIRG